MPSILNLKFKGNKSFVAFSNLGDTESLTKTWKVCTKVASYLEQGQRLENLSWRLWHLQNLMVDTDNAKSKREFKKLSKCMGDKLDKEKGRSIEELEAPDFRRNHSTEMIRQRAAEKERSREASQNAKPGTIKRMQFTFSVDQPAPAGNYPVKKPDLKPSPEFIKRPRNAATAVHHMSTAPSVPARHAPESHSNDMVVVSDGANDKDPPKQSAQRIRKGAALNVNPTPSIANPNTPQASLRFPSVFSSDFGPSALLFPTPTLTTRMNYGEGLNPSPANDSFSVARPTIELHLDELLNHVEGVDGPDWFSAHQLSSIEARQLEEAHQLLYPDEEPQSTSTEQPPQQHPQPQHQMQDVVMQSAPSSNEPQNSAIVQAMTQPGASSEDVTHYHHNDLENELSRRVTMKTNHHHSVNTVPPISQAVKELLPQTVAPSKINSYGTRSNTPIGRPSLTVRTQAPPATRSSGPGATATSLNPAVLRQTNGNNAPGGVKAECSNCGATHTPLWRRGLNDELNCNACGLYCKLHKRPRPKSMRNAHGEGRTQVAPRQETVDVMAQCYNCHTTATPLWRKDDEGKTVCNACGLYYKLHGSARPISMKSDVIRKRSRHDARRMSGGAPDTPSASPGVSRRASPTREASPTLAPDSSTAQITYEFNEEMDFRNSHSELLGALGHENLPNPPYGPSLPGQFPGPYHPDYIYQMQNTAATDSMQFSSPDSSDLDLSMSPRASKRRRMSTDSSSEPPSSAVSYSSFNDGYSSASSATSVSQRSSSEYPFGSPYPSSTSSSPFSNTVALRGSGNTFWHPPMMPQGDRSPHLIHPPMLPPEDTPMDYLHPPMLHPDDDTLFSAFIHPPMVHPETVSADNGASHPPMYANEFTNHDSFDTGMRVY